MSGLLWAILIFGGFTLGWFIGEWSRKGRRDR